MKNILNLINCYHVERKNIVNDKNNEHYINSYVNHIYVINLKDDVIRRNYIHILMSKYNINFEFIIVPSLSIEEYEQISNKNINLGEAGCYLSHMYCLNDAIINKYKNIIIFEDDIIFHKRFCDLFEKITFNKKFDLLFLGASDFNFDKINHKFTTENSFVYKPDVGSKYLRGTFSILYSYKACLEVFNNRLFKATFIDDNLIQFIHSFSNSFYICHPNIVIADLSTTNIEHNFSIENKIKETYYYKKCYNSSINFYDYNYIYVKLLQNININNIDNKLSYKNNIQKLLRLFFRKQEDIDIIEERFSYNFFTETDLIYICKLNV